MDDKVFVFGQEVAHVICDTPCIVIDREGCLRPPGLGEAAVLHHLVCVVQLLCEISGCCLEDATGAGQGLSVRVTPKWGVFAPVSNDFDFVFKWWLVL